MSSSVRDFYDHLAGEYHLIYADWHNAVRRQGAVLDRLLRAHLGDGPHRILDAACGIGTQAIGLALRGHDVRASDISDASVERARTEADALGLKLDASVNDIRRVEPDNYDAIIACDNPLPHLVDDAELGIAARSVFAALRPGGLFVTSTVDYDAAVRARPTASQPEVFEGPTGKRIVFKVWDWAPDGRTYTVNLFIVREQQGTWGLSHHATLYRAILRRELSEIVQNAGFTATRWHSPEESGFFEPILTARRPA